jgi:hypothetical protein
MPRFIGSAARGSETAGANAANDSFLISGVSGSPAQMPIAIVADRGCQEFRFRLPVRVFATGSAYSVFTLSG